jgi:hypothetical protein
MCAPMRMSSDHEPSLLDVGLAGLAVRQCRRSECAMRPARLQLQHGAKRARTLTFGHHGAQDCDGDQGAGDRASVYSPL